LRSRSTRLGRCSGEDECDIHIGECVEPEDSLPCAVQEINELHIEDRNTKIYDEKEAVM
jgi:hypothetical protein